MLTQYLFLFDIFGDIILNCDSAGRHYFTKARSLRLRGKVLMAVDDNHKGSKKKKRRLLSVIFSLASLLVLTYISITLITGREVVFSRIAELFTQKAPLQQADEFRFDVGRKTVFADIGSSIAAAGTLGVQVLDQSGVESLRVPFRMSAPVITTTGNHGIAFDIGGTSVCAFTDTEVSASLDVEGTIVSAAINENGWFSTCVQEGTAYKSIVTVYSDSGRSVYRVSLATGYALSAALSPDNMKLAILSLTDDGSRITIYDLGSENPDGEFSLSGRLILEMGFLPSGEILIVALDSLIIIDITGSDSELFGFDGRRLGGYILSESFIALHLLDFSVGYSGRIISLDYTGKLLGGILTDKAIISMSGGDGYLAVLSGDGPDFYDAEMNQYLTDRDPADTAGASRVISLGGGAFLVAGDHIASVYRIAAE